MEVAEVIAVGGGKSDRPGVRKADVWAAVQASWEAEPGDSVAHVHNAITRAAHRAPTVRA